MRLRLTLSYPEGRISFERRCRLEARALLPSSPPVSLLLTDTISASWDSRSQAVPRFLT